VSSLVTAASTHAVAASGASYQMQPAPRRRVHQPARRTRRNERPRGARTREPVRKNIGHARHQR
jgi:hypothetical protein